MNEEEKQAIRLQCVEMATETLGVYRDPDLIIEEAEKMYNWIMYGRNKIVPKQPNVN